jgi:hypothetical protein
MSVAHHVAESQWGIFVLKMAALELNAAILVRNFNTHYQSFSLVWTVLLSNATVR